MKTFEYTIQGLPANDFGGEVKLVVVP
jgi:hypothetical protein